MAVGMWFEPRPKVKGQRYVGRRVGKGVAWGGIRYVGRVGKGVVTHAGSFVPC